MYTVKRDLSIVMNVRERISQNSELSLVHKAHGKS